VKFILIDRILEIEPAKRIVACKSVSLAEEYLADHFPAFPVLPGVLMVEAMVQASAWVALTGLEFGKSLAVLREARNVTYKSFVAPGQTLRIESICKEFSPDASVFQASGTVEGREIVKGRLTLRHLNLADTNAELADVDARIRAAMKLRYGLVTRGRLVESSGAA
jgi:3-hydroxyacyl-[acyl-carrier-protein] dehydratase